MYTSLMSFSRNSLPLMRHRDKIITYTNIKPVQLYNSYDKLTQSCESENAFFSTLGKFLSSAAGLFISSLNLQST